jgi:hypothetical protein
VAAKATSAAIASNAIILGVARLMYFKEIH